MQFFKAVRYGPREITSRQVKAYERSCRQKQEKFPLFAAEIAEGQRSSDDEMEVRRDQDLVSEKDTRDRRAAGWRKTRARLFALPPHARKAVLQRYNGNKWYPRNSGVLASIIWDTLKGVVVSTADVVRPDNASAMIAALNDRARGGDTFTRRRFGYSPGVMAWLSPNFVADEDYGRPNLYLHAHDQWHLSLDQRVRDYAEFNHNTDPTGERRSGLFEFLGVWFRFEIVTVSHADNALSVAPWNPDLSRRLIWIGLEGETLDIAAATYAGGWRPERLGVDCQDL